MSLRQPPPGPPPGRAPAAPAALADNTPTSFIEDADGTKKKVIQAGPAELPPAGDERRDELKKRDDALAERLEAIEQALGLDNSAGAPVQLSKFAISNEIASKFDMLRVTEAQSEYAYYWANFSSQHGIDVTSHQVMGYEVVCGDMLEARECKDELGRRRIGDVILMRTPVDNYLELLQLDRQKRAMREGVTSYFEELGERYRRRGLKVYTRLNDYQTERAMRRGHAQQIARQQFDGMVRDGRVRGL